MEVDKKSSAAGIGLRAKLNFQIRVSGIVWLLDTNKVQGSLFRIVRMSEREAEIISLGELLLYLRNSKCI